MSDIKFTEEQLAIIGGEVSNVLVSAAAGSGKTTVLVERIIRQIVEGTLSIDKLLVVTFTNDAANHMAEKIEKALNDRIKSARSTGDDELASRLTEQLNLIPNSYIQTIDSFCSRVLKEKGHLINTPEERDVFASGNVILDESNLSLILNRAANLAVMEMYLSNPGEDSPFIKLTNRFGNGRTDDALVSAVVDAFKKLRSIPDYCQRIDQFVTRRIEWKDSDYNYAIAKLVKDFGASFAHILPLIDELEEYCSSAGRYPLKGSGKKVNGMAREDAAGVVYSYFRTYVNNVLDKINDDSNDLRTKYEAIRDITPITDLLNEGILGGVHSIKNDPELEELARKISPSLGNVMVPIKKLMPARAIPSNYTNFLGAYKLPANYQDILLYSYDEHMKSMNDNTESIVVFGELLKLCDKYYAELKAAVHGSDFADQEYGAYEVLKTQDAAEFYRDKFQEIYIDEYQDNSELQDSIIRCFARTEGNGNVFRVGDVKQSIYKFRSADPGIFIEHMDNLSSIPPKETGVLKLLKENHRSSRQILDFVNFVFGQIMTAEASEIEYDDRQTLKAAVETPDSDLPRIVIVNRSSEFWNSHSEDSLASEEESSDDEGDDDSAGSAEDGLSLNDRLQESLCFGVLHEVRSYLGMSEEHTAKDICVLTKTVSKSKMIAQFLNSYGIKAASENRTKIFEDMDIQCVINMIILLGNEYRDEYLMSVMLKNLRFTNFTLDDLAEINAFFKLNEDLKDYLDLNLMVRIRKFCEVSGESDLKERLTVFLDAFDDLRMTSRSGDIDDLVDMIYTKSGIMANIRSTDKLGANKLLLLKDWLTGNFKRYGTDISTIAARLEEMKIKINTDARFDAKDASDEAVHCMSIHKSKGLEYPCVILAFDDGKENGDSSGNVLFDKQRGFIAKDYDEDLICIKKSAERAVYDNENALSENAEALRLLYVALTRAEKYLSIVTAADVGEVDNKVTFINDACKNAAANKEYTFGESHWLDGTKKIGYALMSSVLRASCASGLRAALGKDESSFERIIDYNGFEVQILDNDELQMDLELSEGVVVDGSSKTKTDKPSYGSYDHEQSITIPFKVAVTGINDWNVSSTTHVDMRVKDKEEYMDHLAGKVTSAGQGSIVHLIMQWGDMDRYTDGRDALISNVKELIDEGIFSQYKPEDVLAVADKFADGIISFASSELGKRMNQADIRGNAEYEKPIVFAVPAYEGAGKEDFVLVQGIIDAIFYEDDGAVIVDYKTDNFGDVSEVELLANARSRHGFQVECYSASCEASGIHVKARYLYMVRYGLLVEL